MPEGSGRRRLQGHQSGVIQLSLGPLRNASKLVGYATQPDGSLHEISSVRIPYDSPQGLAGF